MVDTTATNLTSSMNVQTFAYIGFNEQQRSFSAIPRSERVFSLTPAAANVTVAAAGKDQRVEFFMPLPQGYGYVMSELHCTLFGADTADWDATARVEAKDSTTTNNDWLAGMPCTSIGIWHRTNILPGRDYTVADNDLLKKIIIPRSANAEVVFQLSNLVTDGVAMTLMGMVRFLMFDLNQVHHWAVNTPVPVR